MDHIQKREDTFWTLKKGTHGPVRLQIICRYLAKGKRGNIFLRTRKKMNDPGVSSIQCFCQRKMYVDEDRSIYLWSQLAEPTSKGAECQAAKKLLGSSALPTTFSCVFKKIAIASTTSTH